jgi:hypothetical protein
LVSFAQTEAIQLTGVAISHGPKALSYTGDPGIPTSLEVPGLKIELGKSNAVRFGRLETIVFLKCPSEYPAAIP